MLVVENDLFYFFFVIGEFFGDFLFVNGSVDYLIMDNSGFFMGVLDYMLMCLVFCFLNLLVSVMVFNLVSQDVC